jgi:SAM-dependent methyltransferase
MNTQELSDYKSDERQLLLGDYSKHGCFRTKFHHMRWVLDDVYGSPSISIIAGKKILDLGCGSVKSSEIDGGGGQDYEAWFLRMCAFFGSSNLVGIDIYDQDPKDRLVYDHKVANLVMLLKGEGLIRFLAGQTFDIIHTQATLCPTSPGKTFSNSLSYFPTFACFGEPKWFVDETAMLINNLKEQSKSLLKPDGLLIIDDEVLKLNPNTYDLTQINRS